MATSAGKKNLSLGIVKVFSVFGFCHNSSQTLGASWTMRSACHARAVKKSYWFCCFLAEDKRPAIAAAVRVAGCHAMQPSMHVRYSACRSVGSGERNVSCTHVWTCPGMFEPHDATTLYEMCFVSCCISWQLGRRRICAGVHRKDTVWALVGNIKEETCECSNDVFTCHDASRPFVAQTLHSGIPSSTLCFPAESQRIVRFDKDWQAFTMVIWRFHHGQSQREVAIWGSKIGVSPVIIHF